MARWANHPSNRDWNPWKDLHHEHANTDREHQLVELEFAGTEKYEVACYCGDWMYFRATIGALQCPRCRTLAHMNGEFINGPFAGKNARDKPWEGGEHEDQGDV